MNEPEQKLEEVELLLTGSVLYVGALDHHVSQVIFKGDKHNYVYDLTDIKLKKKNFLNVNIQIPIPTGNLEADSYHVYCVYDNIYYDTGRSFTKA